MQEYYRTAHATESATIHAHAATSEHATAVATEHTTEEKCRRQEETIHALGNEIEALKIDNFELTAALYRSLQRLAPDRTGWGR